MKIAALLLGCLLLLGAAVAYPYIHNYYLTPLARLAKEIRPGDDCAATARKFAGYAASQEREGNPDVQYHDGSTADDIALNQYRPPRRLLHLYDLSPFDDVQLTAICDARNVRVEWTGYLGD